MIVSIIIPTYNRADLICQTLDSVKKQTYNNWECIIIDDGSTDNSIDLLKEYCKKDERFKVLQRPNDAIKGAPTCRNMGLENALGDYVIFLDSDDALLKDCLHNRVLKFLDNKNEHFLVFPMGINNGEAITKKNIEYKESYLVEFLSYRLPWSIMCPIWKREFLLKLKGFKEGYQRLNDPELMIRALLIPNVKFKVFYNSSYDSVYNLSVTNWVLFTNKYYQSLLLFIPDICRELEKWKQTELKSYLSGYLKVWFRDFMFPSNKNLYKENKKLIWLFYDQGINSLFKTFRLTFLFYFYITLSFLVRQIKNNVIKIN